MSLGNQHNQNSLNKLEEYESLTTSSGHFGGVWKGYRILTGSYKTPGKILSIDNADNTGDKLSTDWLHSFFRVL